MSLFLTLIIIVYRNETSYLSYSCLCQVITRTSSFSNKLISSLNLSDQLSDTLALKKTGVYCYTTVLLVFVCASACDKFLSNFSQQQMYQVYLFKLWQTNTCSIKKIITICYIVMYLYFTADNSEAETECKVTRSGKYEKVIAGYKKSSPDIN